MGSTQTFVDEFKKGMKNMFDMTNLGLLHYFLGLEVKQGKDGIFLSRRMYVEDLLKNFNMLNCKTVVTPINTSEKLPLIDGASNGDAKKF